MKTIDGGIFDEERALYGLCGARVENCKFEGAADGESALKESRDIELTNSVLALRYPLWHTERAMLSGVSFLEGCRAPLWYARDVGIRASELLGTKAVRECTDVHFSSCNIQSDEFGWFCRRISLEDCDVSGGYFLLRSRDIRLHGVKLSGKYSFQYCKNLEIHNAMLDTKDAFWHAEDVTVYDSVVKGEYLGWYAKNLRFVNCEITGTQPLCYTDGVHFENCRIHGADLAFEHSRVTGELFGRIESIKNPTVCDLTVDAVGELIVDEYTRAERAIGLRIRSVEKN